MTCSSFASPACTLSISLSSITRGLVKSSVVALPDIVLVLNKLNILLLASTKVTVIVVPDPASSDTSIDLTTVVKSILVSEDAGSGTTITVTLVDANSNVFSLFKTKTISGNSTTELLTQPLVMEESEILKVQAGDANELHVIASILEIQPREVTT